MLVQPEEMFIARLGVSYRLDGEVVTGRFEVTDEVRVPGTGQVRASVLLTVADVVAGWGAKASVLPRIPLTVDLTVHPLDAFDGDALGVVSRMLKVGRSTVVTETHFVPPASEQPAVLCHATFMASPRPEDVLDQTLVERGYQPPSLSKPILDDIGVHVVGPGVAELERVQYVMQPSGTIQGGAIALLAEAAAESVTHAPVSGLDVRYLSAVRVGPARALATSLAPDVTRVEVVDAGNDGRLAAVVLARA